MYEHYPAHIFVQFLKFYALDVLLKCFALPSALGRWGFKVITESCAIIGGLARSPTF